MESTIPPPPKASLVLPAWVWVVITLLVLIAVTAAIVLPILLIVPDAKPVLPPSPVITPPPGVSYAVITDLPSRNLLNRLALPVSDGLTRESGAIAPAGTDIMVLTVSGMLSNTIYFQIGTTAPEISGAHIVDFSSSASFQGTTDNSIVLYNPNLPTSPWRQCYASPLTTCIGESWIVNPHLNPQFFAAPLWKTLPSRRCLISIYALDGEYIVSLQSNSTLLPELDVNLHILTTSLSDVIITKFYSSNQINLTFGVAERFTNSILYTTWTDLVKKPPVVKIAIPYTAGRLLGCDMTYDGQFLIVLTEGELRLYSRNVTDVTFVLSDTLYFNPKKTSPNNCAIDRFMAGDWQAVLVTIKPNFMLFLKIDTALKKFMADRIRKCTTSQISNTAGRLCIIGTQPASHVTVGVVSNDSGQQEAIFIGSDF